ncbi:MAG: hypothetical protein HKN24_14005 [Acidimicrobiales bacterium]|nr:hypothetical protein [Acidimicrobiales bacterium]
MDRCISCQNILPRTVDRCPVCGHDNAPAKVEVPEAPAGPQGKDFLDAIGSKRRRTEKAPRITSPRSSRTPKRTGHDGATPLYESKTTREVRESDYDLPDLGVETRSVTAISSRLNSNIKMGRRQSHSLFVLAATVVSLAALAGGTAVGLQRTGLPDQIAMTSVEVPVSPTDEPVIVEGPVENFDPAAIVLITETPSCGASIRTHGAVVEGGTVVAAIAATENGTAPRLTGDEINTTSDIIGLSNPNDLAVLRPADRIENRLRIATTTPVRVGTPLSLVTIRSGKVNLSPAVVTDFQTRDGNVHAFSIGTQFDEDGAAIGTGSFDQGTFVLDSAGDLLGMADNSGDFVTAQRIAETVARFQADPTFPEPVCG